MNGFDLNTASEIYVGSTLYSSVYYGSTKVWPPQSQTHDYSLDYFIIESLEDNNTISIVKNGSPGDISLAYSVGSGWLSFTISATQNLVTVNAGDKVMFKGVNNQLASAWDTYYRFNGTKLFMVYGNAMSLLFGDDYLNNSEFTTGTTANLCGLFYGTTNLMRADNLILPATTCTVDCYNGMFRGCTNLISAPELPATQAAQGCYSSMFEGCINLENAPEINLTSLAHTCCQRMFCMHRSSRITTPKLTKSPILRVATGVTNCYKEMFKGNGNLVEVTCLMTGSFGCDSWLVNCSTTGTFKKAASASWSRNNSGIPSGWTVEDYVEP